MKKINFRIIILAMFIIQSLQIFSQHSEIGFSVTLSGHIILGPYYRYWVDDHNSVDLTIIAAYEDKLIFPHGFNVGYKYYFIEKNWRPSLGFQYSLMIAPVKENKTGKRTNLQLFSLVPGIQYRWNDHKLNIEEFIWISYFRFNKKSRIFPVGLETRFGAKL
jgi:hypothetical protein